MIVATLNEAKNLPRLIESLAADGTDDRPDEIVVADGGSTDGTADLAARLGARVVHAPSGRGVQLAAGAEAAAADLLHFLHADTRVAPGALAAVRRAYRDPRVIATGMRQRVESPARIYRFIERAADLRVRCGYVYGDSGLAVRRESYRQVGGFRSMPIFEDLDLSRRLRRSGKVVLVDEARLFVSPRRWQRDGALRGTLRNWILTLGWAAGMDPERLARHYRPYSDPPSSP
ncbi:MAG: TIGR04283 family arsenosugar biosynthesis glycosyltransferase [Planctomycetota bacterium]|nr:TIGR04283 family arsenosugar biosynthesis glycosyltransferase [Planctomycetota bacterium]